VADLIRRLGLASPAAVLLETGRPFAFIVGQLVWLSQPVLALIFPNRQLAGAAELLEDPESVNALIALLGREPGDGREGQC
jgi:hypothetical protein